MLSNLQGLCLLLPLLSGLGQAGVVPEKRADICGQKGDDRGKGNYDYDSSGKYSTYAKCSARCVADAKCKSFAFGGKNCLLFNVAVSGNFDADSSASTTFYDRGCVSSSPATTPSSTASTSTPTSSSTKPPSSTSTSTITSSVKPSSTPTTTPSATSSTAPGVTVPAGCNVPTTLSMTSFKWFNSTHNLDCANPSSYPSDAKVCWNSASNTVCADGDTSCTCTPYCYTGLPSAAYQPLGYGPPDTISIGFGDGSSCAAANGQSIRRYEIGEGHFDCGSAADKVGFYGDSNKDSGNIGRVYYRNTNNYCNGGYPRYEGSFALTCTHDAGNNATCSAPVPLALTLVGFA